MIQTGPPDNPTIRGVDNLIENITSGDITCTAPQAYADDGSITWYKDDVILESGEGDNVLNGSRYDIHDSLMFTFTRSDNKNILKCEVHHGTITGSMHPTSEITIDVMCMYN